MSQKRQRFGYAGKAVRFDEYPPAWRMIYRKVNAADPVEHMIGHDHAEGLRQALQDCTRTLPRPKSSDYDGDGIFATAQAPSDEGKIAERRRELRDQARRLL